MTRPAPADTVSAGELQWAERLEAALAAWQAGAAPGEMAKQFGGETAGLVAVAAGLRSPPRVPPSAIAVAEATGGEVSALARPRPSFQSKLEAEISSAFDAVHATRRPLSAAIFASRLRERAALAGPRLRAAATVAAVAMVLATTAYLRDYMPPRPPPWPPTAVAATETATPTGTTVADASRRGRGDIWAGTPGRTAPGVLALAAATPPAALLP